MIAYYRVIWFVGDVEREVLTHSVVAAEELQELLMQRKISRGDVDFVRVDAVPEEVYF